MGKARRGQRSSPAFAASRQRRPSQDEPRCAPNTLATAQSVALSALEGRLGQASCVSELYDLALRTVRRAYPSACAVLLEVDAERLANCRNDVLMSGRGRHLVDRIAAAPLRIDADDLRTINHDGLESLERLLERRLELHGLVVGRVRLDGAVVALLVLHSSSGVAFDQDRNFIDRVAERISARMDAAMDALWASVLHRSH